MIFLLGLIKHLSQQHFGILESQMVPGEKIACTRQAEKTVSGMIVLVITSLNMFASWVKVSDAFRSFQSFSLPSQKLRLINLCR